MRVLLIGGNGFIGSHLIDALLNENYLVRVFDISYERFRVPHKDVDYRISHLNNILDLFEAMIDIDIVFHLASTSVPSTSNIDIISDIKNNLLTAVNILNIAVKQKVKKFVYFSSGGAVYGNPEYLPIDEKHPLNPISSYGIIKETTEHYLKLYHKQFGLEYLIIRPSNPYGPRQGHFVAQGIISTFLRKALNGETLQIFGNGDTKKDYIYINDFVKIVLMLIKRKDTDTYNIGSGSATSINDILKYVNLITCKENKVEYTDIKDYDVKDFFLDISHLQNAISNFKFTNIEDGMNETWRWIQKEYNISTTSNEEIG